MTKCWNKTKVTRRSHSVTLSLRHSVTSPRSVTLSLLLVHAAGAFDRQVNQSVKLFTRALPPFLIMIMAGLGGFVLAAILLPLLQLQSLIQ